MEVLMLARLMERVSMQRRTAYGQVMSEFCQDAFEGHVHLSGSERIGRLSFSSVAKGSVWQRALLQNSASQDRSSLGLGLGTFEEIESQKHPFVERSAGPLKGSIGFGLVYQALPASS